VARRAKLVAQGVAVGLIALLFALLAWSLVRDKGGDLASAAERGDRPKAPTFTLQRLDRKGELDLASLRGKAVVLNAWASWCIPCKDEAPIFEQTWLQNKDRGVVVVGINAKDLSGDARRFMRRYGITFPVVRDGSGSTIAKYGITGFPETYVLDREGRVVDAIVGAVNSSADRARLRTAIAQARSS
jgi:cytochrome c biogenesis protein CcmG, thiol:disulfide interchange protein DsbE